VSAIEPSAAPALERDIIVIGASAGGVAALLSLCAALPANLPAAVLIVLHIGPNNSVLPLLLGSRGNNRAVHAESGMPIQRGTIYIAPPDQHMLVENSRIKLTRGPKEHHTRPAVDPLFRSAALAFGPRVIGVVLTGRLDDGTAGLQAVKQCGGLAVVQDPADAEHPSMPRSAMRHVAVDRTVPLAAIAPTLVELLAEPVVAEAAAGPALDRLRREQQVTTKGVNAIENLNAIGTPSTFSCPDCDGVLWQISDTTAPRYRCHTGHAFSLRSLNAEQATATEDAIWAAVRALQVREELLRQLAEDNRSAGDTAEAEREEADAKAAAAHAQVLLRILNEA
jgi:two-component system chemotaxis response regulator CheB